MEYYKDLSLRDIGYINDEGVACVEIWKDIPDYEELYMASDLGRIKSLDRIVPLKSGGFIKKHGKILKSRADKDGYRKVNICKLSKPKSISAHRLVMYSFEGISDLQIDHKNTIKWDNSLSNLRYCTSRQNTTFHNQLKTNSSIYTGVTWCKRLKQWYATIVINKHKYHLACCKEELEASIIYQKALFNWENHQILPERASEKTSEHIGISFYTSRNKWCVIHKRFWVGYYDTEEEAYEALCNHINNLPSP